VGEFLVSEIRQKASEATQFEELRKLRDQFHEAAPEFNFGTPVKETLVINEFHDVLIQRTISLSESILEDKGMGPPPVLYDFVLFGSGGRREQTLWSDQDNGLIYDQPKGRDPEQVEGYFAELADQIVKGLEQAGYPPCDGNVISTEPRWRKSINQWIETLNEWTEDPHWENIRYLLITVDLRCIHGKGILTGKYLASFYEAVDRKPSILADMLHNTLRHKILIGIFGQLIKEQYGKDSGGVNIKYGAYIPMVNGIRLLAVQSGIMESSTIDRLHGLHSKGVITEALKDDWELAFSIMLKLRAQTYYEMENGYYASDGILKAEDLTKELIHELKESLRIGKEMQKFIKKKIGD
jgi:CBS domain-containing protein